MGLLIRLVIFLGIIYAGYTLVADKVIENKLPEWQTKTQELIHPEEARADLLNNLELRLDEIKRTYSNIKNIDLDSIEDPEIKQIVKGIQDNLTEEEFEEIIKLVEDIRSLNGGSVTNKAVGRILEKILPESTPGLSDSTPTTDPTPSTTPPTSQCSWICE